MITLLKLMWQHDRPMCVAMVSSAWAAICSLASIFIYQRLLMFCWGGLMLVCLVIHLWRAYTTKNLG